ncbi:MAPEG family protein [Sphingomonas panacisoli]|uniref:MAPEG family protein n=1 Tax=Sphingomonas panacisoli TaxID=1813879 RepID=A0A5B8LDX9_9SPHN|nr:MAPEG family protein [Sphingomonas panacisoli]QDZ06126.1 MAPEG family protein [Sphingomonas panacisoli]
MILPITLVMAAAAGLINIWLAVRVTQVRSKNNVWLGDGGSEAVVARTRAHTNFVEYAPFVLILIALIELARGPSLWLWGLGIAFTLARLCHGIGMDPTAPRILRRIGAITTLVVLLALSGWALAIGYQGAAEKPDASPIIIGAPPARG